MSVERLGKTKEHCTFEEFIEILQDDLEYHNICPCIDILETKVWYELNKTVRQYREFIYERNAAQEYFKDERETDAGYWNPNYG